MTTKNLIPRADGEGGIGIDGAAWASGVFNTGIFVESLDCQSTDQSVALFKSNSTAPDAVTHIAIQSPSATSNGRTRVSADGDDLFFSTSKGASEPNTSVERMRIDTNGNVGIGTTTPIGKLSIEGSTASDYSTHVVFNNTEGAKDFAIGAGIHSFTNLGFGIIDRNTNEPFLYIQDNGNVGIGTANPEQKLHIEDGFLQLSRTTQTNNFIRFQETGDISFNVGTDAREGAFYIAGQSFSNDKLVTVKSDGDVGIGTTNPESKLTLEDGDIKLKRTDAGNSKIIFSNTSANMWAVAGDADGDFSIDRRVKATNTFLNRALTIESVTSEAMRIDSNGNVGIGTTEPASILELASDASPEIIFSDSTAGDRGSIDFQDGNFRFWSNYTDPGAVAGFATNNFTISKAGDVGIGTLTPGHNLHISGSKPGFKLEGAQPRIWLKEDDETNLNNLIRLKNSKLQIDTVADDDEFLHNRITILNTNGNVGIGTEDPFRNLTLAGNFRIQKTSVDGGNVGLDFNVGGGADEPELNIYDVDGNPGVFTIKDTNVGIGTASPSSKLSVTSPPVSNGTDLSPEKTLTLSRGEGGAGYPYGQHANFFMSRFEGTDTAGITSQSRTELNIALTHGHGENGELSDVDGTNERDGGTSVLKLRSDGTVKMKGPLMVGEATIKTSPDNPESIYFDEIPQAKDTEGNSVTFLTADKLGLGTSAVLESSDQDLQFKLLTDENRFVVGTSGNAENTIASGWYRFNDFQVKGATDIGSHSINPVDTRIYSDESSFILFKTDAAGNRVAHLVGGDEEVSPNNAIALGIAVKVDSTEDPEDIEFVHTDGESYSVINGNSDGLGTNSLPMRQGFQPPSLGSNPAPLLIDGGSF